MFCCEDVCAEDCTDLKCCETRAAKEDLDFWTWLLDENNELCPPVHRSCLSKYVIFQAEEGQNPCCPFCRRLLSLEEVRANVSPAACRAWLRLHRAWTELREGPGLASDLSDLKSVEEAAMMLDLGYRRCPTCGVWIQKQDPGWVTGCEKMTCRCGGRFCFRCGSLEGRCDCAADHDFLDRGSVLSDYSDLKLPWPLSEVFEDNETANPPSHAGSSSEREPTDHRADPAAPGEGVQGAESYPGQTSREHAVGDEDDDDCQAMLLGMLFI